MQLAKIVYFTGTLFLALAILIKWKRRRGTSAARVNRGLRGYVAAKSPVWLPQQEEVHQENLLPA